jgi:thiol-disulfide isomerase/thioredoxin
MPLLTDHTSLGARPIETSLVGAALARNQQLVTKPSMPRRHLMAASLVLALNACGKHQASPSSIVVPTDLYLQNVLAGAFTLSQLGGKAILLELWATTCAICVAEMPWISALSDRYQARGLRVIALAMPYDRPDLVLHFAKERRLPFPLAIDPAGHLLKDISKQAAPLGEPGIEGTPTRLLLKPSGRVVYREQGALHAEGKTLDAKIAELL